MDSDPHGISIFLVYRFGSQVYTRHSVEYKPLEAHWILYFTVHIEPWGYGTLGHSAAALHWPPAKGHWKTPIARRVQTAPDATRSIANRLSFSPPICYPAAASSPAGCDSPFLIIRERILCFHLLSLRFFFTLFSHYFLVSFAAANFTSNGQQSGDSRWTFVVIFFLRKSPIPSLLGLTRLHPQYLSRTYLPAKIQSRSWI